MMTRLVAPAPAAESPRMMNPAIPILSPVPTASLVEILANVVAVAAVSPIVASGAATALSTAGAFAKAKCEKDDRALMSRIVLK